MKKKLFLLITCFVLFSSVTAFFVYRKRQLAEIARKEEEQKRLEEQKEQNNVDQKEENKINGRYFFEKKSIQIVETVILFIGAMFLFWCRESFIGDFFSKQNWFGFATLRSLIITTFLVEVIIDLLIGSISHFFSKDKNKKYLHTLKMSLKKRIQLFSSLSTITKISLVLGYIIIASVVCYIAHLPFYRQQVKTKRYKNHKKKKE